MPSVTRGRRAPLPRPSGPRLPAVPGVPPPLPVAMEQQRQRALTAILDVTKIGRTVLVLRVAQSLTLQPSQCTLAALEHDLRDAVLGLGATLLTHLVRLRGTGGGRATWGRPLPVIPAIPAIPAPGACAWGVRLGRKEDAPLGQRTWCGPLTLERAV